MTATEKKKQGRWRAGESGNPKGRTPGTGEVAKLRESIAAHLPEIITQLVAKAKDGDGCAHDCYRGVHALPLTQAN